MNFTSLSASIFAIVGACLLTGCGQSSATVTKNAEASPHKNIASASAAHPVVVELYQSQGCSSCPPADANVNAIAGRPDVLALSFAVTYWDQLGWKDTFGAPAYTARQWDYARRAGRGNVYTPQVIINGKTAIVGNDRRQLENDIADAGAPTGGPSLTSDGRTLNLSSAKPLGSSTVWLVEYDPRSIDVPIRAGENGGRTIAHRNIVRRLAKLGEWNGAGTRFTIPARPAGLASAVLVQRGTGGAIIAARKL